MEVILGIIVVIIILLPIMINIKKSWLDSKLENITDKNKCK